ncbi:MAG: hypothetical protein KatS3mg077_2880 [Candidatus Binatia bacterium]|nr:MAG: hypothetical protein KatS3mg077_2880 [Candidatus Binatia bacterium]
MAVVCRLACRALLVAASLAGLVFLLDEFAARALLCASDASELVRALHNDVARGRVVRLEIVISRPDTLYRRTPRQTREQLRDDEYVPRVHIDVSGPLRDKLLKLLMKLERKKVCLFARGIKGEEEFVEWGVLFLDSQSREMHSVYGAWPTWGSWDSGFIDDQAVLMGADLARWLKAVVIL